ncbi:hypothetical protein Tco_0271118 [Tanacetum coccineum]
MLTTPESSPSRITSSSSLSPQTHLSTSQPPSTLQSNQTTPITEEGNPMPYESPLQSVHSLGRDEGSLSLNELMDLCTSLSKKVASLVKKLEQTIKTSQDRRRAKVVIFDDEEAEGDPSNQGRSLIEELDLDAGISLVPSHAVYKEIDGYSDYDLLKVQLGTAGVKTKDKGKAIMHESEPPKKIMKRVQVQMSVDKELAKKVFEEQQARFNAEQEARFKAEQEQERIDFKTALELQKRLDEREEVAAKVDQAHDIDWSDPAVLRYHTLQNKLSLWLKQLEEEERNHFARKRARETLSEESAKKQKLEDDTEKEELQVYLDIVLEEESLNIKSLATKQDVLELYRLVKEIFQTASPEGYDLLLWGDLKIMMYNHTEKITTWRNSTRLESYKPEVQNFCGVHVLFN